MQIKTKYVNWLILIAVPFILASISVILDLFYNFNWAIHERRLFLYYVFLYTFTRYIIVIPFMLLYPVIFKRNNIQNKLFGFVYTIVIALLLSFLLPRDPTPNINYPDLQKKLLLYPTTGVVIYFIYQLLNKRR